jgi:excisionase family DNA binding protein
MAAKNHTVGRPPQLIGAKPCSREYGFKYTTLRDLVHRGELPAIRIGRAMYLDRNDVESWIETRKERASGR